MEPSDYIALMNTLDEAEALRCPYCQFPRRGTQKTCGADPCVDRHVFGQCAIAERLVQEQE